MKLKALVFGMLITASQFAHAYDNRHYDGPEWDNPLVAFDAREKFTDQAKVVWITVPNNQVQNRCELESRKRGLGGFTIAVQACSFQDHWFTPEYTCTIVTSDHPTMHSLGHELRHCFQGQWHK